MVIPGAGVKLNFSKEECLDWLNKAVEWEQGFLTQLTPEEKKEWKRVKQKEITKKLKLFQNNKINDFKG